MRPWSIVTATPSGLRELFVVAVLGASTPALLELVHELRDAVRRERGKA